LTFSEESDDRYFVIEIVPDDGDFTATDVEIGQILIGRYYDAPFSVNADFGVGFSWGNSLNESIGGKRSSTAGWLTSNDSTDSYAPFRRDSYFRRASGREAYDFSFSYMEASDLFPSDFDVLYGVDATYFADVLQKLSGSHLPFIFCKDNTSTTHGDYLYARLVNGFSAQHGTHQIYSFSGRVEQEF